MKSGLNGCGRAGILLAALLMISSCGGSSSTSADMASGGGTGITNTFSSAAEMGVCDIMPVEVGDGTATIDFDGVGSGAGFILAVGSANSSGLASSVRLSADESLPEAQIAGDPLAKAMEVERDDGYGPQEILSAWLRASEQILAEEELPPEAAIDASASKSAGFKAMKAAGVGDVEEFKVLSSLSSVNSYVTVTARVRCVGDNVVFYVDTDPAPDGMVSDEQVDILCEYFDRTARIEQDLLGEISDVDGNGKLDVLMTKQINKLGAMGGGIVTGYFYASDLYPPNEASRTNLASNQREIIYTMVPDPQGRYGTAISNDFAMSNLLPAVLPHELQHAISYNQHVFVNGGQPEENWLNEAMSHFIEDYMGYNVENPSRYSMYLASPSTYGVVTNSSPNLMERGASYLFLRFLYEQAADGDAFIRGLSQTGARGVANLEAAFNGPTEFSKFSQFMARWTVALAMTDRGNCGDPRYTYTPRVRAETGNWHGVCLDCEADDNRGTVLRGVNLNEYFGYHNPTIDASTAMFFDVTTVPNSMSISGTQGGGNYAVLIRTR